MPFPGKLFRANGRSLTPSFFQDHELTLRLARFGKLAHIQSARNSAADNAWIDKKNIIVEHSERIVGDIVPLSPTLEDEILAHGQSTTLSFVRGLINRGVLPKESFSELILIYIAETAAEDESDVYLVLKKDKEGLQIQSISSYSDGDEEAIARPRGGIIHAMLNRREEYSSHRHFILPIRNSAGEMRFMYKSRMEHTILRNVRYEPARG